MGSPRPGHHAYCAGALAHSPRRAEWSHHTQLDARHRGAPRLAAPHGRLGVMTTLAAGPLIPESGQLFGQQLLPTVAQAGLSGLEGSTKGQLEPYVTSSAVRGKRIRKPTLYPLSYGGLCL